MKEDLKAETRRYLQIKGQQLTILNALPKLRYWIRKMAWLYFDTPTFP